MEKEKEEELLRPKTIKVYQKDIDKGKGKVGGPPSLEKNDNMPPPLLDTPPVDTTDRKPAIESMKTPVEDTNPKSEILYTVNVDTQEVNVVVEKETTKDNVKNVTTESPVVEVEMNIEKPT